VNLTDLDLRSNHLTTLPASVGKLPRLQKLDLRWNQVTHTAWIDELETRGCVIYR
jgi:Leucine-rich repeat (LRR) protein